MNSFNLMQMKWILRRFTTVHKQYINICLVVLLARADWLAQG